MDINIEQPVLNEAVRAYLIVKKRAAMQKTNWENGNVADRKIAKGLVRDFPNYFVLRGSENYLEFIGISADDVLENYIKKLGGKKRGSKLWHHLADIVITRAKHEDI